GGQWRAGHHLVPGGLEVPQEALSDVLGLHGYSKSSGFAPSRPSSPVPSRSSYSRRLIASRTSSAKSRTDSASLPIEDATPAGVNAAALPANFRNATSPQPAPRRHQTSPRTTRQ